MNKNLIKRDDICLSWYAMSAAGKIPYTLTMLRQRNIYCWAPFHNSSTVDSSLMPLILFRATEHQVKSLHSDPMIPGFIYAKLGAEQWTPSTLSNLEVRRFRTIREMDTGKYRYFADVKKIVEKGKPVKVIDGMFRGLEGYLCRIKGNTSLYVHIPNICVVSIAYIPKSCYEPFEDLKLKKEKESDEQKKREEEILTISDYFNRMSFAAYSPDDYLRLFHPSTNAVQDIQTCIILLKEECKLKGINLNELYLFSDLDEWIEAIETYMPN